MNRSTYRAGLIGAGFVGAGDQVSGDALGQQVANLDGTHASTLSKHARVDLVAGSDRQPDRLERFAQRTGAKTYADWREMIERERLDILSVATYCPAHAEMTLAAAEHGVRAVYCEKPIAPSLADAERMVAACEAAGTLLVVNHNRRFNPNYRRLRDLVANGGLGDLTSVTLQWPTGRLGNVGTHLIDAACMLVSREVRAVSGTLDTAGKPDCRGEQFHDPGGWALLRFEDGLIATLDAADYAKVPGRVVLNGTLGRASTGGDDVTIEFWNGEQETWPSQRQEATSMDRALAEIVAWLDDGAPFSYPATHAVRVLEVILGVHASHARDAAWTSLPLQGEDRQRELLSG